MNIISQLTKEKLFKISLLTFCFSFPFGNAVNNICFGLLIFVTLINFSLKSIKENIYNSLITILLALYFLMTLFSLIYTSDLSYGLKILLRMSPFLVFPVIILNFSEYFNRNLLEKCLKFLLYGVMIAIVSCLIYSGYQTYIYGAFNPLNISNGNFFSYFNLTELVHIHPIYFGTYVLLSIGYLFVKLLDFKTSKNTKVLYFFFLIISIVFLFLLNSFMLIIIFFIMLIFYLGYCLRKGIGLMYIISFLILSIYPMYKASYFLQEKMKGINIIEDFTTKDFSGEEFTAIKARNAKATSSIQLIKEDPLLGLGVGDAKQELIAQYKKNGFNHGVEMQYNSHNQYLTTFIGLGIGGISILIFSIFLMFYESILLRNPYLFFFSIICSLFMLTESILERQSGIVFFAFFSVLLSYNYRVLKNEK